ncbi:MAG: hypothetical protein RSB93_01770, partial [Rikenellaceae bacterium]
LTDITEEQMIVIYNNKFNSTALIGAFMNETELRTIFPKRNISFYAKYELNGAFATCPLIEVVRFSAVNNNRIQIQSIRECFYGCERLHTIYNILSVEEIKQFFPGDFKAPKLANVSIHNLMASIHFSYCSLLTRDSILYLINNARNTAPITVALHATALSRLTQADIALASSKNITLAA